MKQQIIDLWKESFGDSDEFIELFFNRVYKEENTFIIKNNNHIISSLQIIPYEMIYYNTKFTVGYICGVCTSPSERGKGWMKLLMREAIDEMYRREYVLTILIPASKWLFNYYKAFGYTIIFDNSEEIQTYCNKENKKIQIVPVNELLLNPAYNYYNQIQQKRKCAILHSAYDFETILKDCVLDGGNAWVTLQHDQITGLAFAIPANNDQLFIKEIVYDHSEIKTNIVQSLLNLLQKKTAKIRIPPIPTNSAPYGMARILNKETLLQHYLSLDIHSNENTIRHINDAMFTQIIFQYNQRQAYINLMLD